MTTTTADTVELVYTVPSGNRPGRVHRTTCQHIPSTAETVPTAGVDPDALTAATRATCCSPRMFDIRTAIARQGTTPKEHAMTDTTAKTAAKTTAAKPAADKAAKTTAAKPAADKAAKTTKAATSKSTGKAATAKAASDKAAPTPRTKVGTFDVGTKDKFKCQGKCGETLPVKKFPTVGQDGKRAVECRPDRDARTKQEKADRAAAKAKG